MQGALLTATPEKGANCNIGVTTLRTVKCTNNPALKKGHSDKAWPNLCSPMLKGASTLYYRVTIATIMY